MAELEDRIALVTGGAAGIGLAVAEALAAQGASLIIADRDADAAEHAADAIREAGGDAIARAVDVAAVDQLEDLFAFIESRHGRLNILFSHAGSPGPIGFDISEAAFDRCIAANLKSHFFATRHALPLLRRAAPQASIIYTSSTAGLRASSASPLYGATKAAILMLMRAVARTAGPDGIRANAICPGPVDTPFARDFAAAAGRDDGPSSSAAAIPLGRVGTPHDMIGAVLFLASDRSRYVTGTALPLDGGLIA